MMYNRERCKHCGSGNDAHIAIQQKWVQIPLPFFWSPFRVRPGYRTTLAKCRGFELSEKALSERNRISSTQPVWWMIYHPTLGAVLVDMGS